MEKKVSKSNKKELKDKTSLKNNSSLLIVICACIALVLVIGYVALTDTKNTYSATTTACPSGYSEVTIAGYPCSKRVGPAQGTKKCPSGYPNPCQGTYCPTTQCYTTRTDVSETICNQMAGQYYSGTCYLYKDKETTYDSTACSYYGVNAKRSGTSCYDVAAYITIQTGETRSVRVKFDSNGGTASTDYVTCTYEYNSTSANNSCSITPPSSAGTKDGYTFNGWGTSADCTAGLTTAFNASSDTTKYACWLEKSVCCAHGSSQGVTYSWTTSTNCSTNGYVVDKAKSECSGNSSSGENGSSSGGKTISQISIASNPTKTVYTGDDLLNVTGLVIRVTYSDGSTEDINGSDARLQSAYTPGLRSALNCGTNKFTVTYQGFTTSFSVTKDCGGSTPSGDDTPSGNTPSGDDTPSGNTPSGDDTPSDSTPSDGNDKATGCEIGTTSAIHSSGYAYVGANSSSCCTNGWTFDDSDTSGIGDMCKVNVANTDAASMYVKMTGVSCASGYNEASSAHGTAYCMKCNASNGYVFDSSSKMCVSSSSDGSTPSGNVDDNPGTGTTFAFVTTIMAIILGGYSAWYYVQMKNERKRLI